MNTAGTSSIILIFLPKQTSERLLNISFLLAFLAAASLSMAAPSPRDYFAIEVVDEVTGRGVPLVELETTHHLPFVTDSNGQVAVAEPDLLGHTVYFTIRSHGYSYPQDGFGYQGKALHVEAGAKARVKIQRRNIAHRLYRVTGSGIYRDTVLLGGTAPIQQPLLNAGVFGCDSVMAAVYQNKIHWFWGDTTLPGYPLGNFHITGATSLLPQHGGISPRSGVNFHYFTGPDGNVRPVSKMPGDGPTWISALSVLPDARGRDRLHAGYVKIRNGLESYRWGFVVWNDDTQRFDQVTSVDQKPPLFPEPQTHTFLHKEKHGANHLYFANPLPLTRVQADPQAFADPGQYQGFTCLAPGTRLEDQKLDRNANGRLRYSWKTNTPPLTQKDQKQLIEIGLMKPEEALIALRDIGSGREVYAHTGSVYWNDYRKRWVLITVELHGQSSVLGEVWFAEADKPAGPWVYARKIVTHDNYTFYNPKHHPFFDENGGRTIYFEGTYTHTFSGNPDPTPRYDYNQVMYQLDLADPALNLPLPFYDAPGEREDSSVSRDPSAGSIAFFALEKPGTNTVPIIQKGSALQVAASTPEDGSVLFHALPHNLPAPPPATLLLHEFTHPTRTQVYSTDLRWAAPGYRRTLSPICRVWKNPLQGPVLER